MTRHQQRFDLVVVGGGSGGLAAAKRAAKLGAMVALVEAKRTGGTCVLRGCIPKKLMVYAAQLARAMAHQADLGFCGEPVAHAWDVLCRRRDAVVNQLVTHHDKALEDHGIAVWRGEATLRGPHQVAVASADGGPPQILDAKHMVLATGSTPRRATFVGAEHCLDSDAFFALRHCPKSVAIIGGGYIALELGCILAALGSQVTILCRSRLLRAFDEELSHAAKEALMHQGMQIIEGAAAQQVSKYADGFAVKADGQTIGAHTVIYASGRVPFTEGLALAQVGIDLDDAGAIVTDANHQTTIPSIFAIGDVAQGPRLTPIAIRAGRKVAEQLFGSSDAPRPLTLVPTAVFCSPPLASVGLSEKEAYSTFGSERVQVLKARFVPLPALMSLETQRPKIKALIKVVVHKDDDKVIGMHVHANDAPEILQGFAAAMSQGLTLSALKQTLAIHPTLAEEVVLLV